MDRLIYLRKRPVAKLPEDKWTLDNIRDGFIYYFQINNRYPTAQEIDQFEYLPTSRTIQRSFGGLEHIRTTLNLEITNFGRGKYRSDLAILANRRGSAAETDLKSLLIGKFGEYFVHIERPFAHSSKRRLDFYVFSPSGNFGVDIFYPKDFISMIKCLNIKERTYGDYHHKLYLVVANSSLDQDRIDKFLQSKRRHLLENLILVNLETFELLIGPMLTFTAIPAGKGLL